MLLKLLLLLFVCWLSYMIISEKCALLNVLNMKYMGTGFISHVGQKALQTIRQTQPYLFGPQRDFVFWVAVRDEWEEVWRRWRWRGAGRWGRRPKMRIFDNTHINRHLSDDQRLDMRHQQPARGSWVCAGQSGGRRRSDETNSLGKLPAQHCPHMVEQRMTQWGDVGFK